MNSELYLSQNQLIIIKPLTLTQLNQNNFQLSFVLYKVHTFGSTQYFKLVIYLQVREQ